ncbi:MAG: HAD-like domain-containing protein [Podila humilis]|nr:MAG: HAD-like domain-containing protein [Podila humilis]
MRTLTWVLLFFDTFSWEFIATLPPLGPLPSNFVFTMPERTNDTPPITLVLDIDETLVHCATRPLESPDIIFPVEYNQETWEVYGRIRPGMLEFLEKMSEKFEVITFTASQECYAEALLKIIDPEKKFIKHRYYRDSCVPVFGNYVKDLRILNRDLSKVVIIDNSPQAFGYQISNGIPIESWYDDKSDRELAKVMTFLETLQGVEDVRPKIDEQYKLQERIQRIMTQASHQQISMGGLGGLGATLTSTSTLSPSGGGGGGGGNGDTSSSCSTSGTNSLASLQSIVPDNSDMDATMMLFEVEKAEDDFVLQALANGKVESTRTTTTRSSSSMTTTTTTTTHTMTMTTRSNSLDATHNLAKISL